MTKSCIIEDLINISGLKNINKNYYLAEYIQDAVNEQHMLLENLLNSSLEDNYKIFMCKTT